MIIPTGDQNDHRTRPWVTVAILVVNVLVFLVARGIFDEGELVGFWRLWGFIPDQPSSVTLFTHQFVHAGWLHLLGNMLFLWVFGDNLEDWLGHGPFFFFYLAMGGLAALTHMALTASSDVPIVGASGAIAGVMGGYLVLLPRNRVTFWLVLWFFIYRLELPAVYAIGIYIASDLIVGALATSDHVAHAAHLGGFFGGVTCVVLVRRFVFRPTQVGQFGGAELAAASRERVAAAQDLPGGGADEARLRSLVAAGDIDALLRAYIELAGRYRRLPVSTEGLAEVARVLVAAGHETVGVNAIGRLLLRQPPPEVAAALEVQLAKLHAGPLRDAPRARHHAKRALDTARIRASEARAAAQLLDGLPPVAVCRGDELQTLLVLDSTTSARRRARAALGGHAGMEAITAAHPDAMVADLIVHGVSAEVADRVAAGLAELQLPVLRVPSASLTQPPGIHAVRHLRLDGEGFTLRTASGSTRLGWGDVEAAVVSFVPRASARSSVLLGQPVGTVVKRGQVRLRLSPTVSGAREQAGMRVRTVLELFADQGGRPRRFHVDERDCELLLPDLPPDLPPMQHLGREILAHDELLYVAGGVTALSGLEAPGAYVCRRRRDQRIHLFYWWNRYRLAGR